jgi:hypothetical protein
MVSVLREKRNFEFQGSMLKRIFGPKGKEITGGWMK